jgi:glucokinase
MRGKMKEDYVIGVDLGGTNIKFGLVDSRGKIKKKIVLDTLAELGPKTVIKQIKKGIKELIKEEKKISSIGIGAPGLVILKKGTIEYPPNLPGWISEPLGSIIQKEFDLPTAVENDANAAAIGEMIFGAGKKFDSFIMVTLGTGVGGGIIMNKKLLRGENGAAGEIGHVSIDYKGEKCACGSIGCIEAYIGNNYLCSRTVKKILDGAETSLKKFILNENEYNFTPKDIYEAAQNGDVFAIEVIKETGFLLGCALASIVNLLDISNIIIGGGVAGFGDLLFSSCRQTIKQRTFKINAEKLKVIPAKLKNDAGILGASALTYYYEI